MSALLRLPFFVVVKGNQKESHNGSVWFGGVSAFLRVPFFCCCEGKPKGKPQWVGLVGACLLFEGAVFFGCEGKPKGKPQWVGLVEA